MILSRSKGTTVGNQLKVSRLFQIKLVKNSDKNTEIPPCLKVPGDGTMRFSRRETTERKTWMELEPLNRYSIQEKNSRHSFFKDNCENSSVNPKKITNRQGLFL